MGPCQRRGVYICMAQAKLEGRLQSTARYRMMGCACNTARTGQEKGHRIWKKNFFYSGATTCHYFSPPRWADGAQYERTVPAPRNWREPTPQQAEHVHAINPTAQAPTATTRNKR